MLPLLSKCLKCIFSIIVIFLLSFQNVYSVVLNQEDFKRVITDKVVLKNINLMTSNENSKNKFFNILHSIYQQLYTNGSYDIETLIDELNNHENYLDNTNNLSISTVDEFVASFAQFSSVISENAEVSANLLGHNPEVYSMTVASNAGFVEPQVVQPFYRTPEESPQFSSMSFLQDPAFITQISVDQYYVETQNKIQLLQIECEQLKQSLDVTSFLTVQETQDKNNRINKLILEIRRLEIEKDTKIRRSKIFWEKNNQKILKLQNQIKKTEAEKQALAEENINLALSLEAVRSTDELEKLKERNKKLKEEQKKQEQKDLEEKRAESNQEEKKKQAKKDLEKKRVEINQEEKKKQAKKDLEEKIAKNNQEEVKQNYPIPVVDQYNLFNNQTVLLASTDRNPRLDCSSCDVKHNDKNPDEKPIVDKKNEVSKKNNDQNKKNRWAKKDKRKKESDSNSLDKMQKKIIDTVKTSSNQIKEMLSGWKQTLNKKISSLLYFSTKKLLVASGITGAYAAYNNQETNKEKVNKVTNNKEIDSYILRKNTYDKVYPEIDLMFPSYRCFHKKNMSLVMASTDSVLEDNKHYLYPNAFKVLNNTDSYFRSFVDKVDSMEHKVNSPEERIELIIFYALLCGVTDDDVLQVLFPNGFLGSCFKLMSRLIEKEDINFISKRLIFPDENGSVFSNENINKSALLFGWVSDYETQNIELSVYPAIIKKNYYDLVYTPAEVLKTSMKLLIDSSDKKNELTTINFFSKNTQKVNILIFLLIDEQIYLRYTNVKQWTVEGQSAVRIHMPKNIVIIFSNDKYGFFYNYFHVDGKVVDPAWQYRRMIDKIDLANVYLADDELLQKKIEDIFQTCIKNSCLFSVSELKKIGGRNLFITGFNTINMKKKNQEWLNQFYESLLFFGLSTNSPVDYNNLFDAVRFFCGVTKQTTKIEFMKLCQRQIVRSYIAQPDLYSSFDAKKFIESIKNRKSLGKNRDYIALAGERSLFKDGISEMAFFPFVINQHRKKIPKKVNSYIFLNPYLSKDEGKLYTFDDDLKLKFVSFENELMIKTGSYVFKQQDQELSNGDYYVVAENPYKQVMLPIYKYDEENYFLKLYSYDLLNTNLQNCTDAIKKGIPKRICTQLLKKKEMNLLNILFDIASNIGKQAFFIPEYALMHHSLLPPSEEPLSERQGIKHSDHDRRIDDLNEIEYSLNNKTKYISIGYLQFNQLSSDKLDILIEYHKKVLDAKIWHQQWKVLFLMYSKCGLSRKSCADTVIKRLQSDDREVWNNEEQSFNSLVDKTQYDYPRIEKNNVNINAPMAKLVKVMQFDQRKEDDFDFFHYPFLMIEGHKNVLPAYKESFLWFHQIKVTGFQKKGVYFVDLFDARLNKWRKIDYLTFKVTSLDSEELLNVYTDKVYRIYEKSNPTKYSYIFFPVNKTPEEKNRYLLWSNHLQNMRQPKLSWKQPLTAIIGDFQVME